MFELCRVRLCSVGPAGARYQDVVVDLRCVGAPVAVPARQTDLFAADDVEGTPRRPSPASVLFLENGGGKSVLLKLVFSVLLPGRRQVVGTTSTDVLAKFVLAEDVAHVACEWMHTRTGALLVTGKVSAWPGHVVSADPNRLAEAWYSFRPGPDFGLDDLPFILDGRRVSMSGFKDRLLDQHRADPACELVWETGHRDWTRHLTDTGLDPELFRYQRAMNAGEGEAADTFSFPSDEAFVDFLLRAVLDPEEPETLADLVAGYATKIAQRSDLETERDFVQGTLELLGPVVMAEEDARTAREAAASAQRAARVLASSIMARHALEEDRLAVVDAELTACREADRFAASDVRRLQDITSELRRLVACLDLADAERAEGAARTDRDAAQERSAAWDAVEPVLRHRVAADEARRLRAVVDAEQEKARPVLRARQAAAAALAVGLRAMIVDAEAARATADAAVAAAEVQAAAARATELARVTDAAGHRAAADAAHTALAAIAERRATAVAEGQLRSDGDVAAVADAAATDAREAAAALTALGTEMSVLRRRRRAADPRRVDAHRGADTARTGLERADAAHGEALALRDALAAESRLAELLGVPEIVPDIDASALAERLVAALASGEQARTRLLAEQARDQRVLSALGSGGLLPEPAEIEDVLGVLELAGITAYSGWRYLAQLPATERAGLVERLPHLAGGVLLNNPDDADQARTELAAARLLPCAIVTVGSTAALVQDGSAPGIELVVPPNPAMVDEDAAAAVRDELTVATAERSAALEQLATSTDRDRDLLARVRAWRDRRPGIADLEAAVDVARTAHLTATATADAADREVAELDERAEALEAEQPRFAEDAETTQARATALAALALEVAREPELRAQARTAAADAAHADELASTARDVEERASADAADARHTRDRHEGVAERARVELADLPLDDDMPVPAPDIAVEELRRAYINAQAAYAAAEVGADLSAKVHGAEHEAAAAKRPVDALQAAAVEAALELLRSPDGADPTARRNAADQARSELARAEARCQSAHTAVALASKQVKAYTAPPRPVEPYGSPVDVADGHEQIRRAEHDRNIADAAASEASGRLQDVGRKRARVASSVDGFGHVVGGLDERAESGAAPFDGDVDAAVRAQAASRAAVKDTGGAAERAEREVREAVDAVAQFAQQPRFARLTSPVHRHIAGVARADMPVLAGEWADALRPRLRSLDNDLASIGRHHAGIVTRLVGMVGQALRTLRLAQRLSELPDGLGDWSGQQFLRIRFDDVDEAVLRHALGDVVDRTAAAQIARKDASGRRDGMALLLAGVRAALPKGARVEILKPDAVLRTERLRVSQIRDVFSGGQQLTTAIVLYCTMAALRAHQRGRGNRPHAGVLFLDNPIGRASAGYLLEVQFGIARALGVQLVYTTGLFDAGALSVFPLIIRLRNDADLRSGRKYLSVDAQIARAVDALDEPDGSGHVDATRVFRRPARA